MTYTAQFTGFMKATASDERHPLQAIAEFVFTDYSANVNKQGVRQTEASNILRTGLNQPVKVDFTGHRIGDHDYALPVGSIFEMEEKDDKIIGKAIIWRNEFPDLFQYLEKASASEGGVQFSWELMYKDTELDTNGVQWLKDVVVAGIAIVSNPAYAGRTPLLALASEKTQTSLEQLSQKVAAVIEGLEKAGAIETSETNPMELEALVTAIDGLKTTVGELQQKFDALKIETPEPKTQESQASDEQLAALQTEVEELRKFKTDTEMAQAKAELLSTRTQALSSLMTAEEIADKADFILALAEEQFTTFVASLQNIATKQPAKSSVGSGRAIIPDPLSKQDGKPVTVRDIAQSYLKMREDA